jgi:hypothetical protein
MRAVDFADRILKGQKLANLPVQATTKYELVINMKTGNTLSLDVPRPLISRSNEAAYAPFTSSTACMLTGGRVLPWCRGRFWPAGEVYGCPIASQLSWLKADSLCSL